MMLKKTFYQTIALMLVFGSGVANANLLLTFTDDGSGGVSVVGSGSGLVTDTASSDDWDYFDFLTNFIVEGNGVTNLVNSDFAFGTLSNLTTGVSSTIDEIQVDSDDIDNDDFEFETVDIIDFTTGDEFLFSLSASFDASTLAFSNLIEGTHIQPGGLDDEDIFGALTLVVEAANIENVSAPSVIALFALGFLAVRFRRVSIS